MPETTAALDAAVSTKSGRAIRAIDMGVMVRTVGGIVGSPSTPSDHRALIGPANQVQHTRCCAAHGYTKLAGAEVAWEDICAAVRGSGSAGGCREYSRRSHLRACGPGWHAAAPARMSAIATVARFIIARHYEYPLVRACGVFSSA